MIHNHTVQKSSRRKFLRSASVVTGGAILGSSAGSAATQEETVSADSVDLKEKILELMKAGEHTTAKELMEEHDIQHYMSTVEETHTIEDENDVGTESTYEDADSTISFTLWASTEDSYEATGSMRLRGYNSGLSGAFRVPDAMGIEYDQTWRTQDPDVSNLDMEVAHWDPDPEHLDPPELSFDEYRPAYGPSVEVDHDSLSTIGDPINLIMSTTLEPDAPEDDLTPVQFNYSHTRAYSETFASLSISFGPFAVSVSGGEEAWSTHVTAGPNDSNSRRDPVN